jgi:hypothetical protein
MTTATAMNTSRSSADDNGILASVPGQFVAQAGRLLPDPACAVDDEMSVEIDADWAGRVRLTFRKRRYSRPKGKSSYVAWLCWRADPIAKFPADGSCGVRVANKAVRVQSETLADYNSTAGANTSADHESASN